MQLCIRARVKVHVSLARAAAGAERGHQTRARARARRAAGADAPPVMRRASDTPATDRHAGAARCVRRCDAVGALVTAGWDATLKLWDVRAKEACVGTHEQSDKILSLCAGVPVRRCAGEAGGTDEQPISRRAGEPVRQCAGEPVSQ